MAYIFQVQLPDGTVHDIIPGDNGTIQSGDVLTATVLVDQTTGNRSFSYNWQTPQSGGAELPSVTSSDNGKVLQVVGGAWEAAANTIDLTATYDSGVYKITSPISNFTKYNAQLLKYKTLCFNVQLTSSIWIRLIASGTNAGAKKIYFIGYGPDVDSNGELCRYSVVIDNNTNSTTELVINIEKLANKELPDVTSSDNGKFLQVVNGAWDVVSVSNANGVSF